MAQASLTGNSASEFAPASGGPTNNIFLEETDLLWRSLGLDHHNEEDGDDVLMLELKELEKAAADKHLLELLDKSKTDLELAQLVIDLEGKLRSLESSSIESFVNEGESLNKLNSDMIKCDTGLAKLEAVLSSYADQLQSMNLEMEKLEMQTIMYSQNAKAKGMSEAHISAFLDEIMIPADLVREIVDGAVGTKRYEDSLILLSKKAAFLELDDTTKSAAYAEIKPQLDRLMMKAIVSVQTYLLAKVELLRRPNTNIQIIKESVLLRNQRLMEFLQDHSNQAFVAVRDDYVETISILYTELFRKYLMGLNELKKEIGKEGDLVVENGSHSISSWLGYLGSGGHTNPTIQGSAGSMFALTGRIDSVVNLMNPAVILAVATAKSTKLYFEEIYRSVVKMLLDTCSSETVFCVHLFGELPGALFATQFKPTINVVLDTLKTHVSQSHDLIGLLLLLKINELLNQEMSKRKINELSDFFLSAQIILKPKVKELFDLNVKSIQQADAKSMFTNQADVAPKIITRRFAELNASILRIFSFGDHEDDTIRETVRRLRMEFQSLMQRIAAQYSKPKSRYIFLINNYDLVLSFMEEQHLRSVQETKSLISEEAAIFEDAVAGHTAAFVEQELLEHFSDLIALVRNAQKSRDQGTRFEISETKLRLILRDFMSNYRVRIEHLRNNIFLEFPNLNNGMTVLKHCLAQLLNYHRRFEAIVDAVNPSLKSEMVATSALTYEIRKLSSIDGL